jgi:glucose/arabinose dehydrogenase
MDMARVQGSVRSRMARAWLVSVLALSAVVAGSVPAHAATTYKLKLKISGLDQPVYMVPAPGNDARFFIVLKGGEIRIVDDWNLKSTPFLDMSALVSKGSEQGLLSMAFDPDYATNLRFYVYYTNLSGNIVVARYLRMPDNEDQADPNSRQSLIMIPHPTWTNHNGGMMAFDPIAAESGQAVLYFGTGDGGSGGDPNNNSQNQSVLLGKLLRMDVNDPTPTAEIYAYGLRNPWRWSFDRNNGDIRIGDVGQDSWEETDFIEYGTDPGLNFGWRKYEGNHLYHDQVIDESRLRWPFVEYSHSGGNCSITGGYLYRGPISSLNRYYLYADYCSDNIWRRKIGGTPEKMAISGTVSSIVSFAEGNHGGVFIISIGGSIYYLATG